VDNLNRVIGPAPSEMSDEELSARLSIERSRVRDAIERFRALPQKKTRTPTLKKQIKDSGLTYEEIMTAIQEAKDAQED